MNEEELKATFGSDYSPPTIIEDDYIDDWSRSIEIKLNNQGKMIVAIGAGLLVTVGLTALQGKVVITLVKANKMVVDTLNTIINGVNGNVSGERSPVSYTAPQGTVDESKIEPPDPEELEELKRRMEASTKDAGEELA